MRNVANGTFVLLKRGERQVFCIGHTTVTQLACKMSHGHIQYAIRSRSPWFQSDSHQFSHRNVPEMEPMLAWAGLNPP